MSLVELSLLNNQIADEGARALSSALAASSSLTLIDLTHCQISPDGALQLAQAVRSGPKVWLPSHALPSVWEGGREEGGREGERKLGREEGRKGGREGGR